MNREHSLVGVKASVMIYDEGNRKWVPSGSSQGVSKVHIYQHSINNTFRVVGHKLQDHEVGGDGGYEEGFLGVSVVLRIME